MSSSDLLPQDEAEATATATGTGGGLALGPSWQDQDKILRDMWLQNNTPQMIAEALNRSIPAIMTRAARLGLPRRSAPGRKPGRRQTENRESPFMPQRMPNRVTREATDTVVTTSPRICLMCLNKFESAGRQNRICPSCKGSSEYESASALPELHVPV